MWYLFILFGSLAGVIGGMGMGGGTLLIPLLTIFLSVSQIESQGLNLLTFLPMSIIAIIIHLKNKMIQLKGVWIVALSGLLCSVFASFFASKLDEYILSKCFGVFLIILSFCEVIKLLKNKI